MNRGAILAKIHVAKKQLGLDDPAYRSVIERIAGKDSAAKCSEADLNRLLAEFERLGFKPVSRKQTEVRAWVRKIHAIWKDLAPLLDDATPAALNGFVQRQTKTAKNPAGIARVEWLGAEDATPVIQGLEGWLRRLQAAKKGAA